MRRMTTRSGNGIGAAVFLAAAFTFSGHALADRTVGADWTLTADETVSGILTVESGVTVDLNGHVLRVDGIAGSGRIADSKSYDLLDYIEANGAQRIVTDLVPNEDTRVDVVATPTDAASSLTLFGTKNWGAYCFLCMCQNNKWYFFSKTTVVANYAAGTRYHFVVGKGLGILFNDETGESLGHAGLSLTNTDEAELAICGITGNTQRGKFKLHSFKVWQQDEMRFNFVPARNPATGGVGLLNRLDGTLHVSDESAFLPGTATGTLGIGALRVAASSEAALDGFTGTLDANVRFALDGDCTLTSDTDWRSFANLAIDGTVDLDGHDLKLSNISGTGVVTNAYERLDYVEATGAQMVKTGIHPSTDTGVSLDATLLELPDTSDRTIFGCTGWSNYRYLMILAKGKIYYFGRASILCNWTAGTRYLISVTPGATAPNGTAKVVNAASGATLGEMTVDLTNNDSSELSLFDYGTGTGHDQHGIYRLHSFKMTKGGQPVRDLVPVRKTKTGEVGLLDRVSGGFFASCTGTELVAGPASYTGGGVPGALRVDVGEGRTVLSESVEIGGAVRLVKEGTGTLVASRAGQTYFGGTHVAAGLLDTMRTRAGATAIYLASNGYLGRTGSEIVVDAGATFDFEGSCDYRMYKTTLNGGTIRNSCTDQTQIHGSLGTLTLTADSTLDVKCSTTFFDKPTLPCLNLGGYTLSANLSDGKELYFHNAGTINDGTFWLKGNGDWRINAAVNARTATLRVESALWIGAELDVGDYYAACTTNFNNGEEAMRVYGRFTPATDYFYGCELQGGSTLDLNGRAGTWSTTSAFTNGLNRVTFADGATITVDAHERGTWLGKIVDWGAGNMPTNDVRFALDAESKAMNRHLYVRDSGLYATVGLMIFIR